MKKLTLAKLFGAFIFSAFILVGCDDDDDGTGPTNPDPPAAPTGIMATSIDNTTIRLQWTASTSEGGTDFAGYTLTVSDGTTSNDTEIAAGVTTFDVTALVGGTVYTFSLSARNTDGTLSANAATIDWATARRFTMTLGNAIELYERSSSFGSGVQLYDAANDEPAVLQIASANNVNIDVAFDNQNNTLVIGSPTKTAYTDSEGKYNNDGVAKTTLIGKVYENVATLDDIFDTQALDESETLQEKIVDFTNFTNNFAFVVKTQDNHFAKVLVKTDGSGNFLQGNEPNRYVVVEISYQTVADVPYAIFQNPPRADKPSVGQESLGVSFEKIPFNP